MFGRRAMKPYLAFMGSAMFCVVCFSLYLMLESTSLGTGGIDVSENDLSSIEVKIKAIESDLKRNHKTINMIKDAVRDIAKGDMNSLAKLQDALQIQMDSTGSKLKGSDAVISMKQLNFSNIKKSVVSVPMETCSIATKLPPKPEYQMQDVFDVVPFDNPNGGVWKQGYDVQYDASRFKDKPLKVFVVPHSHDDPGWLKTFERYYLDQTRHILDNMVDKLEAFPKMRFIYAEISFFSLWWGEIPQSKKERVKKLIQENRLEIVTGGWVMTDEANAHYFAMLDQMIEGNTWLQNQVGAKPKSGWAIDPFGHSPTMAYLLKRMGFTNMLIQRVHYSIKKHLAKHSALEFNWRQVWDHEGSTDMLCHMMPFYSYDVPHTCGPDPKTCCQFDFKRLPGGRLNCPWKVPPVPITEQNVALKAETLLDQYRKKSTMYGTNNVVLAPIGDDFRYDKTIEWDQQYQNYQKLFDYMNTRTDWNVQAQFGTLSDYFNAVHEREGVSADAMTNHPTLSGDFYTYADRDDHYWSGYYTSRPFYKRLDRILESHLRGSEIIFSLAQTEAARHHGQSFPTTQLMKYLVSARRNLGLFQHHDGITGTAKDFVVVDYGTKMLRAIMDLKNVIRQSSEYLLTNDKSQYKHSESNPVFDLDENRKSHDSLPERTLIKLTNDARPVAFYNSLGQTRTSLVRLYVDKPHLEVKDSQGKVLVTQVDPFWNTNDEIAKDVFKLVFIVTVPASGMSVCTIRSVGENTNSQNTFPEVIFFNAVSATTDSGPFHVKVESTPEFSIENNELKAVIKASKGTLKSIFGKEEKHQVAADVEFLMYGTRATKEKSGAYLFLPNGQAQPVLYERPFTRVIKGPLLSEVQAFLPHGEHVMRLHNTPGVDSMSLEIFNIVDIKGQNNKELCMRIKTNVKSQDFYTDLNGFQIQRRKYYDKLPLQANFYPMPTMTFIQDDSTRFTVLSAQSLGVASLQGGWIEVMQDRRLNQDDGRGLGQGVLDNKRTPNKFRILLEKRQEGAKATPVQAAGYPSLLSHTTSLELIHPLHVLPPTGSGQATNLKSQYEPLTADLPCEVHLLNLRAMQNSEDNPDLRFKPQDKTALILHRLGFDCSFPTRGLHCQPGDGKVILGNMFKEIKLTDASSTSLSLIHDSSNVPDQTVNIPTMEIQAYKVKLS